MPQPNEHFKGLVVDLRSQVTKAVAKARALKSRGESSLGAFQQASNDLSGMLDEVDAATAEINGVLVGDPTASNGGPTMADVGNSPAGSEQAGGGANFINSVTAPFVTTITAPTPVR